MKKKEKPQPSKLEQSVISLYKWLFRKGQNGVVHKLGQNPVYLNDEQKEKVN